MIVAIHQPDYIPYWGYFYKIACCDTFVFLDDCQYSSDNMHHWNRIKTPQGEMRLKIPVENHLGYLIRQVRTKDELGWKEKHLKALVMNYSRAPYFHEIYPWFKALLEISYPNLAEMNIAVNTMICGGFGFAPRFIRSSELGISSVREERVIEICTRLGGAVYLSGNGARAYQVEEHFTERGVALCYTEYRNVEYPQLWGNFVPNMSILDYLFNCGFKRPTILFER